MIWIFTTVVYHGGGMGEASVPPCVFLCAHVVCVINFEKAHTQS